METHATISPTGEIPLTLIQKEHLKKKAGKRVKIVVDEEKQRTGQQNRALHVFFQLLSDSLNDAGLPMQEMLKVDIDWTPDNVKKYLWGFFQEKIYGISRTRDLKKQEQIDKIHKTLMRELGEKRQIEYIEFPNDPDKELAPMVDSVPVWHKKV